MGRLASADDWLSRREVRQNMPTPTPIWRRWWIRPSSIFCRSHRHPVSADEDRIDLAQVADVVQRVVAEQDHVRILPFG